MLWAPWQSKPWPGVGIDWNHPLAQGLVACIPFNEGSGPAQAILDKTFTAPDATAGTFTWVNSPSGPALNLAPGCYQSWNYNDAAREINAATAITELWLGTIRTSNRCDFAQQWTSTLTNYRWNMLANNVAGKLQMYMYVPSTYYNTTGTQTLSVGTRYCFVGSAGAIGVKSYINGKLDGSAAGLALGILHSAESSYRR